MQHLLQLQMGSRKILSNEERAALAFYTGTGSEAINSYLRGRARPADALGFGEKIALLDQIVSKGILRDPMVIFRGIDRVGEAALRRQGLEVDAILTDDAFMSCTHDLDVALRYSCERVGDHGGLLLTIDAPKGSCALDIAAYSNWPQEEEILLPRGTQLKVVGYDPYALLLETEIVHG